MNRVFVYGTLKEGEPNEHVMRDGKNGYARFLSRARTQERFPLLIASKYNVPYLLYKPGIGYRIFGEVFEVDDRMFSFLDGFENCPEYYRRLEEHVELEDGSMTRAWLYTLRDFKEDLLQRPMMADYSSKGPHGLEYNKADVDDPGHTHYDDVKRGA
ncbi:gamma-glutamylaminecyclotransferase [Galendromus occidentalis]|uniref:Gamma-glutamylcyclotransferase family protein n=1 Tax=Galendromus occidentalis TaxID=34638 RepID=A0AAJ6QLU4_9ACAR|nr:gamma-glutamylaminecyclotransferase [Galendromus occidentalis]